MGPVARESAIPEDAPGSGAEDRLPLAHGSAFPEDLSGESAVSEHFSEVNLEIGHVLFIDIVGYTKLLINEQSDQLEKLRKIARATGGSQGASSRISFLASRFNKRSRMRARVWNRSRSSLGSLDSGSAAEGSPRRQMYRRDPRASPGAGDKLAPCCHPPARYRAGKGRTRAKVPHAASIRH